MRTVYMALFSVQLELKLGCVIGPELLAKTSRTHCVFVSPGVSQRCLAKSSCFED